MYCLTTPVSDLSALGSGRAIRWTPPYRVHAVWVDTPGLVGLGEQHLLVRSPSGGTKIYPLPQPQKEGVVLPLPRRQGTALLHLTSRPVLRDLSLSHPQTLPPLEDLPWGFRHALAFALPDGRVAMASYQSPGLYAYYSFSRPKKDRVDVVVSAAGRWERWGYAGVLRRAHESLLRVFRDPLERQVREVEVVRMGFYHPFTPRGNRVLVGGWVIVAYRLKVLPSYALQGHNEFTIPALFRWVMPSGRLQMAWMVPPEGLVLDEEAVGSPISAPPPARKRRWGRERDWTVTGSRAWMVTQFTPIRNLRRVYLYDEVGDRVWYVTLNMRHVPPNERGLNDELYPVVLADRDALYLLWLPDRSWREEHRPAPVVLDRLPRDDRTPATRTLWRVVFAEGAPWVPMDLRTSQVDTADAVTWTKARQTFHFSRAIHWLQWLRTQDLLEASGDLFQGMCFRPVWEDLGEAVVDGWS